MGKTSFTPWILWGWLFYEHNWLPGPSLPSRGWWRADLPNWGTGEKKLSVLVFFPFSRICLPKDSVLSALPSWDKSQWPYVIVCPEQSWRFILLAPPLTLKSVLVWNINYVTWGKRDCPWRARPGERLPISGCSPRKPFVTIKLSHIFITIFLTLFSSANYIPNQGSNNRHYLGRFLKH